MQLFTSKADPNQPSPSGTAQPSDVRTAPFVPQKIPLHSTKAMVQCALLIAISIVLTHLLTISTPFLRINLGGVPILLAGVLFGPVAGFVVGALADLIGGTLAGYSINFMITLGTALTGFCMGLCYHYLPLPKQNFRLLSGVVFGNLIGSVIVNTLALRIYYGYAWSILALRIPNNIVLGAAEFFVLWCLCKNKALMKVLQKP
ncbi:MAG: folate family ECF transporter S component [Faecalibacterium sp.]